MNMENEQLNQHRIFNIVGHRTWWYILSATLIIPGIVSLFVWGLNFGIDFKGGTMQQIDFPSGRPSADSIRAEVKDAGINAVSVQTSGDKDILIRYANENSKTPRQMGDAILSQIKKSSPNIKEVSFENIGASVAKNTTRQAVIAVIITSLALIIFIAWAFGSVPKPASSWRFGVSAIAALAHDILFVVGMFSIIGHFFPNIEVDALFITAILTILGFSVNDTIVVFDRIRENLRRNPGRSFEEISNISLNQTLARSLNTSLTVIFVLLALVALGGDSIRNFILALTLGIITGTYSSIFNATPILVSWQGWVDKRAAATTVKTKRR
jgi:preprotein translocase subunit SecF